MLGKLIKYDLKVSSKLFILLHAAYLFVCIISRILYMNKLDFKGPEEPVIISLALFISVLSILMTALMIFTELHIAFRFYRSMFSREGYLSWTLPVSGTQHLWAKIISGYILAAADIILIAVGILILITGRNITSAYSLIADEMTNELGMPLERFALLLFTFCVVSCISTVIMIYFCIVIGQLFPGHRVLCAIATYFILSTALQVFTLLIMLAFGIFPGHNFLMAKGQTMTEYMTNIFYVSAVLTIIITIVQYVITHYIMNKKINLL